MNRAILVASLGGIAEMPNIERIRESATWLEVDASCNGAISTDWLRSRFRGELAYSFNANRSCSTSDRQTRLIQAADGYDIVDLNAEVDLIPETLQMIPAKRRMITWEGRAANVSALLRTFERISKVSARFYRLVIQAETFAETCVPLAALKRLNRQDVLAFAAGEIGFWTRLVAPRLGAPLIFGSVTDGPRTNGKPAISELVADYRLPHLPPIDRICGIIGSPVLHSQSPRLHNFAYQAARHATLFAPFSTRSLEEFWACVVERKALEELGLTLGGMTVASPFKEEATELPASRSGISTRAKSSNLLVQGSLGVHAETTDPETVMVPLAVRRRSPVNQRVAVIGCGGSGRAIAAALDQAGAHVTLVNRGMAAGNRAAQLLGLPFVPLSQFDPRGFSIIVNATPVGRHGEELPFSIRRMDRGAFVIDLVYGTAPTPLVIEAREAGHEVADGHEVLAAQVRCQFQAMTGCRMEIPGDAS
jgi:3-dehydroquinate dehydratase/shikimate dehydrogenase